MNCPSCARPVALAREKCLYCGGALPHNLLEEAALAARRVLQSGSLSNLEAAATGNQRDQGRRRYLVVDMSEVAVERIATSCGVSLWEARQWQAASRYRLVKVSTEPADGPTESRLKEAGLTVLVLSEETIARGRLPVRLESIDTSSTPAECTLREDPEAPLKRRAVPEADLALVVSASIRREKARDLASLKKPPDKNLEDAFLVHLHLRGQGRPWEIDPRRTVFEGPGLASAYMRTLDLVRRLSRIAPHDDGFKYVVPALGPGLEDLGDLPGLKPAPRTDTKRPKLVVLDNVAQFRDYSAWRGALALEHFHPPRDPRSSGSARNL